MTCSPLTVSAHFPVSALSRHDLSRHPLRQHYLSPLWPVDERHSWNGGRHETKLNFKRVSFTKFSAIKSCWQGGGEKEGKATEINFTRPRRHWEESETTARPRKIHDTAGTFTFKIKLPAESGICQYQHVKV